MLGAATAPRGASEGEQRAREPFAEGPCPTIAAGPYPTIADAVAHSSAATTGEARAIATRPYQSVNEELCLAEGAWVEY